MKRKQVTLGHTYAAKVSGKVVPVRIDRESPYGGWDGTNTVTGREVRIKTAARLRYEIKPKTEPKPDYAKASCGHLLDENGYGSCGCSDGEFYGTEEISDADPGL